MRTNLLRRLAELQFVALLFALPFEYYFAGKEVSLYSSLKLQIILLTATWAVVKAGDLQKVKAEGAAWYRRMVPGRLLIAVAVFLLAEGLAAAFAPSLRANAEKAAAKWVAGAFLAIVAADLSSGFKSRVSAFLHPLYALSMAGTCAALVGLGELAGLEPCVRVAHLFQSSAYFLGSRLRLVSTMEYPNTAGSILSASLFATLAAAALPCLSRDRKARNWTWPVLAGIVGAALMLTYSRGAVTSAVLAIVATTWLSRKLPWERHAKFALAAWLAILAPCSAGLSLVSRDIERDSRAGPRRVARYGLAAGEELMSLLPGHEYSEIVAIRNDSEDFWKRGEYDVAYRWYSLGMKETSSLQPAAAFADDLPPGREMQLRVTLRSPVREGEYLLIWYVSHRNLDIREVEDSYSPAILCVVGCPGAKAQAGLSPKAQVFLDDVREERRRLNSDVRPGRSELWRAAIRMFREKPLLGMGPDSFRFLKWSYMDVPSGNETILANSVYLELLSGSGLLGLLSFLWLLWEFGRSAVSKLSRTASPSDWAIGWFGSAYIIGFVLHGFVDYFLKFTPTFLLFWLTLGMVGALAGDEERPPSL